MAFLPRILPFTFASISALPEFLNSFVTYVQTHLTGDEHGEAADFLDHLFRAITFSREPTADLPFLVHPQCFRVFSG